MCSFAPVSRFSVSTWTPTSIDVRNTRLTDDRSTINCPMRTGCRKCRLSTDAVTHGPPRVADRGHRGGQVHQVHHFSAEDVAQAIGVVGQRQFRVFGDRFAYRFALHKFEMHATYQASALRRR